MEYILYIGSIIQVYENIFFIFIFINILIENI